MVSPNCTALIERVRGTTPTVPQYYEIRDQRFEDPIDIAFKVLFVNRCSFSGLGKGVRGGVKQDGEYKVNDKWKLDRLVPKLERTNELLGGRTTVTKLNAMDYLIEPKEGVVFADPPYFVAGDALYPCRMSMAEHFQLADRLRNQRRWLATYDDSCVVRGIYSWASVTPFDVQYVMRQDLGSRRHCRELLIGPHVWN